MREYRGWGTLIEGSNRPPPLPPAGPRVATEGVGQAAGGGVAAQQHHAVIPCRALRLCGGRGGGPLRTLRPTSGWGENQKQEMRGGEAWGCGCVRNSLSFV